LSPSKLWYRAEIDGLRAFAVLSVVAYHAFPSWLKGGFIGVDVFFVISGFLITSHIFENLDKGQFSFTDFFGRRIRRIFPALILVMACSLAFGWFALLADEFAQLGKHVASGAAFITNFILVDESGYFDNAAETKPMLHLWSLAVEEQFYIVWPLVLWLGWKRKFNLLTITVLVAVISFYLNLRFVKSHPTETFFWSVGRFWELLSGSVLAWLFLYKSDELSRLKLWVDKSLLRIIHFKEIEANGSTTSNLMSFFGLLLLTYGAIRINESLSFPSKWALIPVLGTLLIIASGSKAWLNRIFLMNPIAVWFGLFSYPLYLWHWPILSFLQIIEGEMPHRDARIIAVFLATILAWVTYRFIEKPIRFGTNKSYKTAILIVLIVFVGTTGMYFQNTEGLTHHNQKLSYISKAMNDWEYPKGLIERNGFLSTSNKDPSVLFIGDSHIEQYGPRIVQQYSHGKIEETAFITQGGCLLIPNDKRVDYQICNKLFEKIESLLAAHTIKTVILGFCYNCYFVQGNDGSKPFFTFEYNNEIYRISSEDGLLREDGVYKAKQAFYDFVKKLSLEYDVVVLMDNPNDIRFHPKNIIGFNIDESRPIPLSSAKIEGIPFTQNEQQIRLGDELIASLQDFAIVVNQQDKICPNGICHPTDKYGRHIYRDSNHMRPFFVKEQMDVLDPYLLLPK